MIIDECMVDFQTEYQSMFEKWVEQATRLFRSATRRPEACDTRTEKACPYWLAASSPCRPASRRTAQASGLCYPCLIFQTGSKPNPCRWIFKRRAMAAKEAKDKGAGSLRQKRTKG